MMGTLIGEHLGLRDFDVRDDAARQANKSPKTQTLIVSTAIQVRRETLGARARQHTT